MEERGLTERDAEVRRASVGPNEPSPHREQRILVQLVRRFASPLVAILLLACVASAIVGDLKNALLIGSMVALSVAVEFVQTHRAGRAAAALRARVADTATVLRDGSYREVPRRDLVPDDVIRLAAGDLVPADARLLRSNDLHVNEAALTGESLPVEKEAPATVQLGSSIVSGTATAVVTGTGPNTAFAAIAEGLSRRRPPTEFERGTTRFGVFILKTILFLVLFVFIVTAALRKDPLESLLFAIALAVGLTPEFLPMITTVTLSKGALAMARRKVIVKNLASIQNFGSIDVLCSDKTGTLTKGVLTLEAHVDPMGAPSERPLVLAYLNSYFESGIDNPLDDAVLRKARLDPLDSAVLRHDHPDIHGFVKVDEVPFDFERRRVSVVAARGAETLLVTKGAPENVIGVSSSCEIDGETRPLDPATRRATTETATQLGMRGYRVLAVAYAAVTSATPFSKRDEHDLTLAGLLAFVDPPRDDAREVLAELRREGIRVKVLTGDAELVAKHVCERVGISTQRALLGSQIDAMSDPALGHRAERTDLFARVTPAQKTRILQALRSRGHVVGFLGDGINDAPSMHAADVGISVMGAVDVARDAADIILLEPSLQALLAGVCEGRKAFGNVMKYLLMGTSSSFGNMLSMAGAAALLPFLPMLPHQILLNNLLYNLAQLTIPTDQVDPSFVKKPRRWNIDVVRRFALVIGPVSSLFDLATFAVLLRVFHATERSFHTGWFVESLATQTLVIFVIRTMGSPLRSKPSLALAASVLVVVTAGCTLPLTPLGAWFGFVALPASFFAFVVLATVAYLALVELVKRAVVRRSLA
jgi:Mg2+-importing ATPase